MSLVRPGDLLGERYRVLHPIARGGMGAVYEAEDLTLGRRVALKVLLAELTSDLVAQERFRREARAVAAVRHEGLVAVYDLALSATPPYLVMELVDGPSLRERIASDGRLPWRDALHVTADVLSAVGALHDAGIVHRDLKPANVLLEPHAGGERARVIDLGVALLNAERDDNPLTATDFAVGTPAFMPPEQLAGRRVGPAADMWAVGVLLYNALTGTRPIPPQALADLVDGRDAPRLQPIGELVPGAPPELDAVLAHLLHPDPAQRPREASALAAQLRALAGGERTASRSLTGTRSTPRSGGRHGGDTLEPWPLARATVAAVIGLVGLAGLGSAAWAAHGVMDRTRTAAPADTPAPASAAPSPAFVWTPPTPVLRIIYGQDGLEAAVSAVDPELGQRMLACFPRPAEVGLGWVAGYRVDYGDDGRVTFIVDETLRVEGGARRTPDQDACLQGVLREARWPVPGVWGRPGAWVASVSVGAAPPS